MFSSLTRREQKIFRKVSENNTFGLASEHHSWQLAGSVKVVPVTCESRFDSDNKKVQPVGTHEKGNANWTEII